MKISDTIKKRVFDQNAETVNEIMQNTGATYSTVIALRNESIKLGKWEEVYKRVGGKPVKAYRLKKK